MVGTAYSQSITSSAGPGVKKISYAVLSGAIPSGLSFTTSAGDPSTLILAGTPKAAGAFILQVTATDSVGATARQIYVLTIGSQEGSTLRPVVTAVSPASGSAAGGTTVTIAGKNLAKALAAKLGSIVLTKFSSNTATQIVLKIPKGTAGIVDVRVVTGLGISAITSADQFQYQ